MAQPPLSEARIADHTFDEMRRVNLARWPTGARWCVVVQVFPVALSPGLIGQLAGRPLALSPPWLPSPR